MSDYHRFALKLVGAGFFLGVVVGAVLTGMALLP